MKRDCERRRSRNEEGAPCTRRGWWSWRGANAPSRFYRPHVTSLSHAPTLDRDSSRLSSRTRECGIHSNAPTPVNPRDKAGKSF